MAFELWIEEHDKAVWHLATSHTGSMRWRVACGWEMTPADTRIYPMKPADPGPPQPQRCHSCVAVQGDPAAIPIHVRAGVAKDPR